jgi:hypothetical protein
MIKIGIICPIPHLQEFAVQSNFHLVLPHLIKQFPKYKEFYRKRAAEGDFVLLDNSIFELDKPLEDDELVDIYLENGFSEVVAPETINDSLKSAVQLDKFLNRILQRGLRIPVLAMIQGRNFSGMLGYAEELNGVKEITTLGVPFRLEEVDEDVSNIVSLTLKRVFARWNFLDQLNDYGIKYDTYFKALHLMGLSDAFELQKYNKGNYKCLKIRSNDSSSAFIHGGRELLYTDRGLPCEKISSKLDFTQDLHNIDSYELVLKASINHNIKMIKKFAGYDGY